MKTENTPEEKARFFALYWGAGYVLDNGIKSNISVSAFMSEMIRGKSHLELTPLSQISDEDAIEVARILGYGLTVDGMVFYAKRFIEFFEKKRTAHGYEIRQVFQVLDFLRSRGYYVGDGTEVEYGWAVLKGGEHES